MGRNYALDDLYRLFGDIRRHFAEVALRTTLIVGFPGESNDDFKKLVAFVTAVRFDHVGVFTYSDGEDLPSHRLDLQVAHKTAQRRRDRLMEIQADISLEKNRRRVGHTIEVLVERQVSGGQYQGRTMFQAPEVDGVTFIQGKGVDDISPGNIVPVKITGAADYDLTGVCE